MGNDRWRLLGGQFLAGFACSMISFVALADPPPTQRSSERSVNLDSDFSDVSVAQLQAMLQRKKSKTQRGIAGRLLLLTREDSREQLALTTSQQQSFQELLSKLPPKPEELRAVAEKTPRNVNRLTDKQAKRILSGFLAQQKQRLSEAEEIIQATLDEQQFETLLGLQVHAIGPTALFDPIIREHCDVPQSQIRPFMDRYQKISRKAAPANSELAEGLRSAVELHASLDELDESILQSLTSPQRRVWDRLIQRGE